MEGDPTTDRRAGDERARSGFDSLLKRLERLCIPWVEPVIDRLVEGRVECLSEMCRGRFIDEYAGCGIRVGGGPRGSYLQRGKRT